MLCFCASTVGAYFLYICSVQVHLRFLFKLFTVVAVIGQSIIIVLQIIDNTKRDCWQRDTMNYQAIWI